MGVFGNVMRGIMAKFPKEDKPNIRKVYEAGKLLGLEKEDVSSLLQKRSDWNTKGLIWRYWYVLLPTIIVIALIALFILFGTSTYHTTTYPAGTRYGVISTKDFRRKHWLL